MYSVIAFIAVVILLPVAILVVSVFYVAAGSSDVNGDPERDSGMDSDDISRSFQGWDRGSSQTELRPNLEHERRLNRTAMRRYLGA